MNIEFIKEDWDVAKIERIKNMYEWFYSNYEYFRKNYPCKHVAIDNKKVLDCDESLDTLVKRLQITDYRNSIVIEYVYP